IISKFDVVVALATGGRTGKGIELFSVVKKGSKTKCTLAPLPSAFTAVGTLSPGPHSGWTGFGVSARATKIMLGGQETRLAVVGMKDSFEVFFLNPVTGAILDGTVIGGNSQPQPHLSLPLPLINGSTTACARFTAFGDLNADGVPDIASCAQYAFLGSIQNGILAYSAAIPMPQQPLYGAVVEVGELDGQPGEEIAVGLPGGGSGGKIQNGRVLIYKYDTAVNPPFVLYKSISSPLPNPIPNTTGSDLFGQGIAIGDVTGGAALDLVVHAPGSILNQPAGPGRIFVFAGYALAAADAVVLSIPGATPGWTAKVAVGDLDGTYPDVVGIQGTTAPVFSGLVTSGQSPTFILNSVPGFADSFGNDLSAGDLNADDFAEVLTGAPNSSNCPSYNNLGAAYVFMPSAASPTQQPDAYLLESPSLAGRFGFATAVVPDSRLFLITCGEEVCIYKVN
ncbi:MAG: FG-GAP repeat protein, partial [Burkholderiales bacterium]